MIEIDFRKWLFVTFSVVTVLDVVSTVTDLSLIPKAHELNPLVSWSLPLMLTFKIVLIPVMFAVLYLIRRKEPVTLFQKWFWKIGDYSSAGTVLVMAAVVVHNFYLFGFWLGGGF